MTIAALAGVAIATHEVCATAKVLENLVTVNSTFDTTSARPVNPLFGAVCGANFYREFYYKYTATCNGVGLIAIDGNTNATNVRLGVFTGTCADPVPKGMSSSENKYLTADMTDNCTTPAIKESTTVRVQNSQFVAVIDTEYIISVGTTSPNNFTDNGDSVFNLNVGCAAPASPDSAAPTEVMEGTSVYSNIGGSTGGTRPVSTTTSKTCLVNAVFMEYTAMCTGTVVFSFVPPPAVAYDGFHGEDLQIGLYEGATVASPSTDICQDDPAFVYANATASDTWTPPGGAGFFKGGVKVGNKYTIVAASFTSSAQMSPFVLKISPCEGDTGAASTVGVSMAALVAWMVL